MVMKYFLYINKEELAKAKLEGKNYIFFSGHGNIDISKQHQTLTKIEITEALFNLFEVSHPKQYRYNINLNCVEGNPDLEDELLKEKKQERITEVQNELDRLDYKSIRAVRALESGTGTEEDREFLSDLELQAQVLRTQLQQLQEEIE